MNRTEIVERLHDLIADDAMVWCNVPHCDMLIAIERRSVEQAIAKLSELPNWRRRRTIDSVRSAIRRSAKHIKSLSQREADELASDMTILFANETAYGDPRSLLAERPGDVDLAKMAN